MSLWSIEAFFIIPAGAICLALLLSDIPSLQRLSMSCCSIKISFGRLAVSISSLIAIFTTAVFLFQSVTTLPISRHVPLPSQTVEMLDRIRMKEWRNDRNWWISLFACTLWLICWRIQVWVQKYCLTPAPAARVIAKDQPSKSGNEKKKD